MQHSSNRHGQTVGRASRRGLLGCFYAAVLLAAAPAVIAQNRPAAVEFREGRVLVAPRPGLSEERFNEIVNRAGGRARGRLRGLDVRVVEVPAQAEAAVARALARRPHIDFAEVDRLAQLSEVAPNDPRYPDAWHLQTIGAPAAWEMSTGLGVTVAVLDTGVDGSHLDLIANLERGWNAVSNSSDTSDPHGHGTSVAGTVAAETDNGLGVASVAWQARILPVRVTNRSDGAAYLSDIAQGITWAADRGARVANVSFDAAGSATVVNAAQYMRNRGGIVVIAAGNSGINPGYSPSNSTLVVAATGTNDTTTSWSNHGNFIDLAAPGSGIWSTKRGGSFGTVSGTSFSSPITAAVVSLVMAANPDLTPGEVEAVLFATAEDLGAGGWDDAYGYGRVDAAAAVAMAANSQPSDSQAPFVIITDPDDGATVEGTVEVDVDAADNFGVSYVELLVNGTVVATDYTAPYGFSWDSSGAASGAASLIAHAYDAAGNRGLSDPVTVSVANNEDDATAPTVTITSPADGATVSGTVSLAAFATDDGTITEVRLLVDGKLKCAGAPSVACSWNTKKASEGAHSVSARATDSAGNIGTSAISVIVGPSSTGKGGKGGGRGKPKR